MIPKHIHNENEKPLIQLIFCDSSAERRKNCFSLSINCEGRRDKVDENTSNFGHSPWVTFTVDGGENTKPTLELPLPVALPLPSH